MNAGYHEDELGDIFLQIACPLGACVDYDCAVGQEEGSGMTVFDVLEGKMVDPLEGGILDSTPAVLEAVRNSISIASLLGTCGGIVAFLRDHQLDRQDARDTNDFLRNANSNEADERP